MTLYFGVEPFEPANMMYVGIEQELEDNVVSDACDYVRATYGNELSVAELEHVFEMYDIDYPNLAKYNQDRFDEFDVY